MPFLPPNQQRQSTEGNNNNNNNAIFKNSNNKINPCMRQFRQRKKWGCLHDAIVAAIVGATSSADRLLRRSRRVNTP